MRAIGLMSGTSADGIDAALIESDGIDIQHLGPGLYTHYGQDFRKKLLSLYGQKPSSATDAVEETLTQRHAKSVEQLLRAESLTPEDIDVIGFHGQTILHCPPQGDNTGETFQLGKGQLLADLTGIKVVCNFRQADMVAGGQGAPLIPVFHEALVKAHAKPTCFVNIGGVANVTWVGEDLLAFDTGPGNALIDDWVTQHTAEPFDDGGKIAAHGTICRELLQHWLSHPYFAKAPPKSLDRGLFQAWCFETDLFTSLPFEDQVATLTAFTAHSLARAQTAFPRPAQEWIIAGGGSQNPTLLSELTSLLNGAPLKLASDYDWDAGLLEAHAFGFLAIRSIQNQPLTFPKTTGVPIPSCGGVAFKPHSTHTEAMA